MSTEVLAVYPPMQLSDRFTPSSLLSRRSNDDDDTTGLSLAAGDPSAEALAPSTHALPPRTRTHSAGPVRTMRPALSFRPMSPILSPSLFTSSPESEGDDYMSSPFNHERRPSPQRVSLPLTAPTDDLLSQLVPIPSPSLSFSELDVIRNAVDLSRDIDPPPSPVHVGVPSNKRPPLFHIPSEAASDNEDDDVLSPGLSSRASHHDLSLSTTSKHDPDRRHVRQFHALMELLTTEAAYLADLRILVDVYLHDLDTIGTVSKPKTPTVSRPPIKTSSSSYAFGSSLAMPVFVKPMPTTRSSNYGHGHSRSNSAPKTPSSSTLSALTNVTNGQTSKEAEAPTLTKPPVVVKQPPTTQEKAEKPEKPKRGVVSAWEKEAIRNNASELLAVQERFVAALQAVTAPFGLPIVDVGTTDPVYGEPPPPSTVQQAIAAVARAFITSAPSFSVYDVYASRHPDAQDVVRRFTKRHPLEWQAFESRCALKVTEILGAASRSRANSASAEGSAETAVDDATLVDAPLSAQPTITTSATATAKSRPPSPEFSRSAAVKRSRRHSLSSLTLVSKFATAPSPDELPSPPASTSHTYTPTLASTPLSTSTPLTPKLAFLDYLIKPIQRICRYPLLLDALCTTAQSTLDSTNGTTLRRRGSGTFAVVTGSMRSPAENASQVMRGVVAAVDEARRVRDSLAKSALIVARLSLPTPVGTPPASNVHASGSGSGSGSGDRPGPPRAPTPAFVSSLGPCSLAGPLDILHTPPPGAARVTQGDVMPVKYHGVFLYAGGYLLIAKPKTKTLEPKHWIPLERCDVDDMDDLDSILPNTVRIRFAGHSLDLVAACTKEKRVWLDAIYEALSCRAQCDWLDEPFCSLQWRSMPAVQSRADDDNEDEALADVRSLNTCESSVAPSTITSTPGPSRVGTASRRSSILFLGGSNNVQSSYSPPLYVRRASPSARLAVERVLADILSPLVLAARFKAQNTDEELWPAGGARKGTFSRSGSALRLTSRDTLVLRRGMSSGEGVPQVSDIIEGKPLMTRSQSTRWKTKSLLISPISAVSVSEDGHSNLNAHALAASPIAVPDSPDLLSACSSIGPSVRIEPLSLPASVLQPISAGTTSRIMPEQAIEQLTPEQGSYRPKRTRSLVDNFKGMFGARGTASMSPVHAYAHGHVASASSPSTTAATPSVVVIAPDVDTGVGASPSGSSSPARRKWWSKGSLRRRVRSAPTPPDDSGTATPTSISSVSALNEAVVEESFQDMATTDPSKPVRRRSVFVRRLTEPAEAVGTTSSRINRRQSLKLLFSSRPSSPSRDSSTHPSHE